MALGSGSFTISPKALSDIVKVSRLDFLRSLFFNSSKYPIAVTYFPLR